MPQSYVLSPQTLFRRDGIHPPDKHRRIFCTRYNPVVIHRHGVPEVIRDQALQAKAVRNHIDPVTGEFSPKCRPYRVFKAGDGLFPDRDVGGCHGEPDIDFPILFINLQ